MQQDFRLEDQLVTRLPDNLQSLLLQQCGDYYRNIGTRNSVALSVKKMDSPTSVLFRDHPHWDRVKERVFDRYCDILNQPVMGSEEIYAELSLDASSGQPWSALGFKKKRDFFANQQCTEYLEGYLSKIPDQPPLWKVAPKTEWYALSDIVNQKVRTFIVPPVHFLYTQKKYFGKQNYAMKEVNRSAYGFNPYSGGVNRYAQALLKNKVFACWDVKGWDRLLPILKDVYELRVSHFHETEHISYAKWVAAHTCESHLLLPDGSVVWKDHGNNSGSGNTTTDNILAHELIFELVLIDLYGDEEYFDIACNEVTCFIFGDDIVASFPYLPRGKDFEATVKNTYLLFGLLLDPFKLSFDLRDMEFLGFHFHCLSDGNWVPKFNAERLVTSFCYCIEKNHDLGASLSKAFTLTVMMAGANRDLFDVMRMALSYYRHLYRDHTDPVVHSYVCEEPPTYDDCINFYLGYEGSCKLTAEGGIKICRMQRQNNKNAQRPKSQNKKVGSKPPSKSSSLQKKSGKKPAGKRQVSTKALTLKSQAGGVPHGATIHGLRMPKQKGSEANIVQSRLKKKSPWYQSILNPLHGADAKIPDATGVETGTMQMVQRLEVTVGAQGLAGAKILNPFPAGGGLLHNWSLLNTASSFPGTISWGIAAPLIGNFATNSSLGSLTQGVRIVSACVMMQPEGSLANNGGIMTGFVKPWDTYGQGQPLTNYTNGYKSALIPINNNKPCSVRWFPVDIEEHDSGNPVPCSYTTFWDPAATDTPGWEIGVIVSGATIGNVFEVIMVVNYEFIPIANSINIIDASPSPQDAMEVDLVSNWVQDMDVATITSTSNMSSAPSVVAPQHGEEQTGLGMFADVIKEVVPFALALL